MRKFDLNRNASNAVRAIAMILAATIIVVLIRRGTAWYVAMLLGFGTVAVLASLAFLIDLPSRKPRL